MKRWISRLAPVLLLAAACGKSSDTDIPDTRSNVMVYNMAPGEATYDILLDTAVLATNLAYGASSQRYRQFRAQNYTLRVYAAGDRSRVLNGGQVNLRNGRHYSVFLGLEVINNQDALQVVAVEDELTPPATATNARVRVVNLSDTYARLNNNPNTRPSQLAMDFWVDTLRPTGFRGLRFGFVTPYVEIVGREQLIEARWTDSSKTMMPAGPLRLQAVPGKVYTIVATGKGMEASFRLWPITNN